LKKNPILGKHSHNNRESREGLVLKYIREAKKLSLQEVAEILKIKRMEIDHFENGRKFYTPEDISNFLEIYQLSLEEFQKLMEIRYITKQLVNSFLLDRRELFNRK
jgi:transcriptional regulator with XRE-family HTH domain